MAKNYKEIICHDYSSAILPRIKMIDGKYPYSRDYECLSFSGFLKINLPGEGFFIEDERLVSFNHYLDKAFPKLRNHSNKCEYLTNNNLLLKGASQVDIRQLKFYQDEINIDRLDQLAGGNYFLCPVLVVKFENDLILQDGYHRTLISFLNKSYDINCFII